MAFIETTLAFFIGNIMGSFTTYFVQRYFFKKFLDNALDKIEEKTINFIKKRMNGNQPIHNT